MNKTLFHVCTLLLEPQSIINPGNFGRVIQLYRQHDLNALSARELCFEIVRLKQHPGKPSRLDCLFLFPTAEHALRYVKTYCFSSVIYEVEILEQNSKFFHGNMGYLGVGMPTDTTPAIPYLMALASEYWKGIDEIVEDSEFIVESPVRVLSKINVELKY